MRPLTVISEMTPPHSRCGDIHREVAQQFKDIGYDVTVTERLPSDCCGDFTSRQRWLLIARLRPSGPLDIPAFANKGPTAVKTVLDTDDDVDPDLYVDCEFEPIARDIETLSSSSTCSSPWTAITQTSSA